MSTAPDTKLVMRNIRCFRNEHVVIKPLTILVGDNSTGKTTTLASAQTVLETLERPVRKNWKAFNQNPYAMGDFKNLSRQVAHDSTKSVESPSDIVLSYASSGMTSKLRFIEDPKRHSALLDNIRFKLTASNNGEVKSLLMKMYNGTMVKSKLGKSGNLELRIPKLYFHGSDMQRFLNRIVMFMPDSPMHAKNVAPSSRTDFRSAIKKILTALPQWRVVGAPPIRPPARRIYRFSEYESRRVSRNFAMELFEMSESHPDEWDNLKQEIIKEGQAHDLFSDFYIKKYYGLFKKFEIMTVRDGIEINICDLGAGIWQVLQPLIALKLATILDQPQYFMFQQPDEHAHPRLQDHMASLYCRGLADRHRFLIETHSDYIMNRISIEISKGEINPDLVSVAFFSHEAGSNSCIIQNRRFNEHGKIMNIPEAYKNHYSKEIRSFL